jgi:hypothetical protein
MPVGQKEPEANRKKRESNSIVDSRLHVRHDTSRADMRNAAFFSDPANRAHLASQLLVYEHLIIPTNDFALVPALIQWMGLKEFEEALETDAFRFLRRNGRLAYGGNGLGITAFVLQDTPEKPFKWWENAFHGELDLAVDLQLRHGVSSLSLQHRESLIKKVIARSQSVDYSDEFFTKNVVNESYADIRDTPELRKYLIQLSTAAGHPRSEPIDIVRVPGLEARAFQIAGDGVVRNPADLVVRVAEANMEVVLADLAGGTDLLVSSGTEKLLKQKVLRANSPPVSLEGFGRLLDLNKIPDIRAAVESGGLSLSELWKVRQSSNGRRFRKWLSEAELESGRDLERLYVESLGQSSLVESLPLRVLRFALTTIVDSASTAHPAVGLGVGIVDNFFVEKFLKGYRPKLMFDELKKLLPP